LSKKSGTNVYIFIILIRDLFGVIAVRTLIKVILMESELHKKLDVSVSCDFDYNFVSLQPDSQKSHSIIEKTASFISKHGTQMEIILKAKQAGNPQFDFLNFGNWLNPYYKLILEKIKEGTYKIDQTSASNNDNDEADDSKSESESDSSDEYVHPLLQAHRRPLKTQAETSADHGQKGNVDSSTFEQDVRNSSSILPHKLYANAAEVYMARKYEHLRKDRIKIGLETSDVTKSTDNDDWADHLEEDRNFSSIDQSGTQFSYEMLQYMLPPPPPPSSGSSSTSDVNRSHHVASPHNSFPSQPPPPGDSFSSVEKPFLSNNDDDPQQQQHQQQYFDHIVPPPPDLKSVVDKLAEYVARNGEVFEEQIKHKNDPRFEFLSANNIYFPYYLYRKQQSIMKMQSDTASMNNDKREKAGKPLSFALKKKSQKSKENKLKSVEIFKSNHDDGESDIDDETKDSLDGYRPNIVQKQSKKIEKNMEEKAKETMEKAKIMIAEAQKKQRMLQQERDSVDEEVQMERRRKAAAFIGMLKRSKSRETSSSSSESSSDEEGTHRSEEDESSLPRRHFKESKDDL